VARTLAAQGLSPDAVPPAGQPVRVLANANLSTGGRLEDLTGRLPADAERLAVRAAGAVGLRLAGVDLLAPDLLARPEEAVILEVNGSPGLDYYAAESPAHWARARDLLAELLA
jgi:D-alanine-D-alanine ligase-like ATP-grasp enzyme